MDQVSNFFENILTVEPNDDESNDTRKSTQNELKQSKPIQEKDKLKRKSESDFAFWSYKNSDESRSTNTLLTDKLMEKIISMVIPMNVKDQGALNQRLEMQKTRPPLSVNLISKNSILLNLRLSVPFETIDSVIKFFNWDSQCFTIGVLLVITHMILNPYLIFVLPIFQILFNVMVPHYLILHPSDTSLVNKDYFQRNPIPDDGPALHEYKVPKPVPEFSNEFVLNLTDLQNHMLLYVTAYDMILWATNDLLFFKDENISAIIFLGLFFLGVNNLLVLPKLLSIILPYLPIKLISIFIIWLGTISCHPVIRNKILNWIYNEETRLYFVNLDNRVNQFLLNLVVRVEEEQRSMEVREAEIFELQKYNTTSKIWELVGFTNDFYTINNPIRKQIQEFSLDNDNEKGNDDDDDSFENYFEINATQNINSIRPPIDWEFKEGSWKLDLSVNDWVNSNLLADIVMIDADEKWVYDVESPDICQHFRRRRWVRTCTRQNTLKDTAQSKSSSAYNVF